jgi:alpha-1,3-glucosyltransferase
VSWLCGYVADRIDPSWIALGSSHGIESPAVKLFMRSTVLVCDLALFLPVLVWALSGKPAALLLAVCTLSVCATAPDPRRLSTQRS